MSTKSFVCTVLKAVSVVGVSQTFMSCANKAIRASKCVDRLLLNMVNSKGLRMEPQGTPLVIASEFESSRLTNNPKRLHLENQMESSPITPMLAEFARNMGYEKD